MTYSILGLVILILDIIAILNVIQSGMSLVMKLVWCVVILALPVIGLLLWYLIGAKRL